MAKLYAYLIPKEENDVGLNGWASIKKHPERLVDFSMVQTPTNADIASAVVQFTWLVVKNNRVYESHRKYIDLDNDRIIYTFYEVDRLSEIGTLQ